MNISEKHFWATTYLNNAKLSENNGLTFDALKEKLIGDGNEAGYSFTEEEAIQLIRVSDGFKKKVISDRRKNMARDEVDNVKLYPGIPENFNEVPHWAKYLENLRNGGWPDKVIKSLDTHCTAIVDAIIDENEKRKTIDSERVKGLVVGHVQSGKTANMAGVMALCADEFDIDLIIVLSGVHSKLNSQTTRRFENDLWTYQKWSRELQLDQVGIRTLQSRKSSWSNITVEDDNLKNSSLFFSQIHKPAFGVFKKNSKILETLRKKIADNPPNERHSMKVLLIDDECDQASPNVADKSNDEESQSKINEKIWQIMDLLPNSTYIGYTATPFASILNEQPGKGHLYPSSFIYKLPKNPTYFGIKEFFGTEDYGDDGLDIIRNVREIGDQEFLDYDSAKEAIGYFVCSSAERRFLRKSDSHFTMLVHTSHKQDDHAEVADVIKKIVNFYSKLSLNIYDELEKIWKKESSRVSKDGLVKYNGGLLDDYSQPKPFKKIKQFIPAIIKSLEIRVDNSDSSSKFERLDYDSVEPLTIIAIGGNTLSRGLTLEGLNVTYFTRPGRQYDSLLQMGRWFGYRIGYEDLVRVWTTKSNEDSFRYLCMVEEDIRDQIEDLYENADASPDEVSLTVLSHPNLKIVRDSAMQEAVNVKKTYFGAAPQTIYFKRNDNDWLVNNWNAGKRLLSNFNTSNIKVGFEDQIKKVFLTGHADVIDFFNGTKAHQRQYEQMDSEIIGSFIKKAVKEGYLTKWHVAIATSLKDQKSSGTLLSDYKKSSRSRLKNELDSDIANIGALRSRGDLYIDFLKSEIPDDLQYLLEENKPSSRNKLLKRLNIPEMEMPGLLLLYPIDMNSRGTTSNRIDLEAVHDMLGWSVVFPFPKPNRSLINRVGIDLKS